MGMGTEDKKTRLVEMVSPAHHFCVENLALVRRRHTHFQHAGNQLGLPHTIVARLITRPWCRALRVFVDFLRAGTTSRTSRSNNEEQDVLSHGKL